MPRLAVLLTSTRPNRSCPIIADWFIDVAKQHGAFDIDRIDLAEVNLPFMDEPKHPRLQQYTHEHTKQWSKRIDAADAFVFVSPEYNFSMTAPLKNAIDYLQNEWNNKALGLVTYGGISAGLRAARMIVLVAQAMKMVTVTESVMIPMYSTMIKDGVFTPNDIIEQSATDMLNSLVAMNTALSTLRS